MEKNIHGYHERCQEVMCNFVYVNYATTAHNIILCMLLTSAL